MSIPRPSHPDSPRPLVIGHRGSALGWPENTVVSFQAAIDAGAEVLELDLRVSRDGVLFLFHDLTLERTSTGSGPTDDLSMAELGALDAGSWKDAKYAGERIPTFEQVALLAKGRAPTPMIMDLKVGGLAKAIATVLDRTGFPRDQVVASVWNEEQAVDIRQFLPEAALFHTSEEDHKTLPTGWYSEMQTKGYAGLSLDWELLDEKVVQEAHHHGLRVNSFTINLDSEMKRAIDLGLDGIISDDPGMLSKVRSEVLSRLGP